MSEYQKTGYLRENFKIFHIKDQTQREFRYHYHNFHKILVMLGGNVTYYVEGNAYRLLPDDIVLIPAGEIHRPQIHDKTPYERIILYISPDYLETFRTRDFDLLQCFPPAAHTASGPSAPVGQQKKSHVLRFRTGHGTALKNILSALDGARKDADFADALLQEALFVQFMIQLNRAALHRNFDFIPNSPSDDKIFSILSYLNAHLKEPFSVDHVAGHFYLNRYYLMHMFKQQTGYTLHGYVELKRLELARQMIFSGTPVAKACEECGFPNYSTFSRSYKKKYGVSPREDLKSHSETIL